MKIWSLRLVINQKKKKKKGGQIIIDCLNYIILKHGLLLKHKGPWLGVHELRGKYELINFEPLKIWGTKDKKKKKKEERIRLVAQILQQH